MGYLFDLFLIASIMVWIVGLAAQGSIGAGFAGLALVMLVAGIAIGRATRRGGASSAGCTGLAFRVFLPIASILTFAATYGQGELTPVLQPLGVLFIMLLGLYVMFAGISSRWRR